jgi:hypothetical protein
VRVIDGAAHAAHHTHVGEFVGLVEAFLDARLDTDRRIGA